MTKQNFVIRAFQLSLPELNYGTQSFFNFPFRQSNTKSSEFDSNKKFSQASFIFVKQPEITFYLTLFGF